MLWVKELKNFCNPNYLIMAIFVENMNLNLGVNLIMAILVESTNIGFNLIMAILVEMMNIVFNLIVAIFDIT